MIVQMHIEVDKKLTWIEEKEIELEEELSEFIERMKEKHGLEEEKGYKIIREGNFGFIKGRINK